MDSEFEELRRAHLVRPENQELKARFQRVEERASRVTRFAVFSNAVGNLQALEAVLADIKSHGITELISLGNMVGFGARPAETIDRIRKSCTVSLKGSYEQFVLNQSWGQLTNFFGQVLRWNRRQLFPSSVFSTTKKERWAYLTDLPESHSQDGYHFCWGAPRNPTSEYLVVEESQFGPNEKFEETFEVFEKCLFVASYPYPFMINQDLDAAQATDIKGRYTRHKEEKVIVNVGFVGHSRRGGFGPCWVELRGQEITWHVVEYDAKRARMEASRIPGHGAESALRLSKKGGKAWLNLD